MTRADTRRFDVAYIGDFSRTNWRTSGVADEIAIHDRAGYSTVLLHAADPEVKPQVAMHEPLEACVRRRQAHFAQLADTSYEAALAIVPNPMDLFAVPARELRLEAARTLLVVQESLVHRDGTARYDLGEAAALAGAMTGGKLVWVPSWPPTRAQLESKAHSLSIADFDWRPVMDSRRWSGGPRRARHARPVVGRHARPKRSDWPPSLADFVSVYPLSGHLAVSLLGAPDWLLRELGAAPQHWRLYPCGTMSPERFLRTLDVFVLPEFDSPRHCIDRGVLEALTSGAVALLPRAYESYFGDSAVYGAGGLETVRQLVELYADENTFRQQARRGQGFASARHGREVHLARLKSAVGAASAYPARDCARPAAAPAVSDDAGRKGAVLFLSTNGVGLGHVTRQLAIAKRLPTGISPFFATMSQGLSVLRNAGYHAEYIPFHGYLECDVKAWNGWLRIQLDRLIEYFGIGVLVFDGQFPYSGLREVIGCSAELKSVWCRRAMWQRPIWQTCLDGAKYFDLVIEPGELAAAKDVGATVAVRDQAARVAPIILLDESDLLDRTEARRRLGLDQDRPAVLLQLGSGHLPDVVPAVDWMIAMLQAQGNYQVAIVDWVTAAHALGQRPRVTRLAAFPNARYFRAFDFIVSAAGYNSFHELLYYGIPCVFVPLEVDYLDNHLARAEFAAEQGMAHALRLRDVKDFAEVVGLLADPEQRAAMTAACRQHRQSNGAETAAKLVAELVLPTVPG